MADAFALLLMVAKAELARFIRRFRAAYRRELLQARIRQAHLRQVD